MSDDLRVSSTETLHTLQMFRCKAVKANALIFFIKAKALCLLCFHSGLPLFLLTLPLKSLQSLVALGSQQWLLATVLSLLCVARDEPLTAAAYIHYVTSYARTRT